MSRALRAVRWAPPFVVGVAVATTAEVAAGLLLYSGPGMLRSLTTVLAVEAATLGLGLWAVPEAKSDIGDALRRRWLFFLGSMLTATVFTGAWSLVQRLGNTAAEQGLGLAFLAALPLYSGGALLGAMSTSVASDSEGRTPSVGGTAALGAAVGFAADGLFLARVVTPASLLLVSLILVSAGGLLHGAILEGPESAAEPATDADAPGQEGSLSLETMPEEGVTSDPASVRGMESGVEGDPGRPPSGSERP